MLEALALPQGDRELAIVVMMRWYGIPGRAEAETIYERGRWLERRGFPCYEGIGYTLSLYDSSELRKYSVRDFLDDSLLRELEASGFIDAACAAAPR